MYHILQDIQYISRKNDTNIYWELRWAQTFIFFFIISIDYPQILQRWYYDLHFYI